MNDRGILRRLLSETDMTLANSEKVAKAMEAAIRKALKQSLWSPAVRGASRRQSKDITAIDAEARIILHQTVGSNRRNAMGAGRLAI